MKQFNTIKNEQLINLRNHINKSSNEDRFNFLFEDEKPEYIRLVKA